MNKKKISIGVLGLAIALTFTACGKKAEDRVEEEGQKIEDKIEEVEDKVEDKVDEVEEDLDKEAKRDAELRIVGLFDEIVEKNYDGKVSLDDYKVSIDDDTKKVDDVEFKLFLDVENEDEAKKLIDEYSDIFEKEFKAKEDIDELTLKWRTPNSDDLIEKYY